MTDPYPPVPGADDDADATAAAPAADARGPAPGVGTEADADATDADAAEHGEPHDALADLSVESLLDDVERLTRQRDEYLDALRRSQAEFENYRKRMMKQQTTHAEQVAGQLVDDLLPVLDACDGAVLHGATDVEPVFASLLGVLEKGGLERIDPLGEVFDPTRHEAVMHEPCDDDGDTVVADVMRRGYAWKGRVLRPAMVKVRG